jgi:pSer/pThr/pTyr-binding forkhead associated (FHA) protein
MPIDSQQTCLTVGSSDQADIVINQPTVSRVHCRFDWNGQGWILQDLNSTNGTFVNATRISKPTILQVSDKITLGRGIVCEIPERPVMATSAQATSVTIQRASDRPNTTKRKIPLSFIGAITGLSLAVVPLIIILIAKSFSSSNNDKTETAQQAALSDPNLEKSSNSLEKSPETKDAVSASEQSKSIANPQSAMWIAVVESADGKTQKLLGTAIAIDSKKLVTLASLAHAAELVKEEFPQLRFVNLLDPKLSILSPKVRLHPNYTIAMESFAMLEKDLAEKMKSIKSLEEPSLEEKLRWSERYEAVMEAVSNADLAIVESNLVLPSPLSIAQAKSSQKNDVLECRLLGFPLITPSPQVTGNVKAFWLELQGQATSRDLASRDYQVETLGIAAVSTVSLACVDNNNQLLGIVSRHASGENNSLKKMSKVVPVRLFD